MRERSCVASPQGPRPVFAAMLDRADTVRRLKDALDPAGLQAPGKQGIRPALHLSTPARGID
ncbi:hypothetical protein [Cupriavidus basilensis]|uniref:Uncharacterized protein n=1 Tax=Cupriavidus basilensis TaxID=68895 RepID=A0A0C4YLT1_9BURK|nr:hypothetical protein [Cupriavidus basilensis]AJG24013.1 hypothetical protein RR42_s2431 [Cupriavidus basilensis]